MSSTLGSSAMIRTSRSDERESSVGGSREGNSHGACAGDRTGDRGGLRTEGSLRCGGRGSTDESIRHRCVRKCPLMVPQRVMSASVSSAESSAVASAMLRLSSSLLKFSRAAAVREGVPGDKQAATLRTIGELGGVVVVMFDGPAFVEPDTISAKSAHASNIHTDVVATAICATVATVQ